MFWVILGIQVLGLTSALVARVSEGYCCQTLCQRIFMACLALVGICAFGGCLLGPGYILMCGSSLAFMAIGAISDFKSTSTPQPLV